MYSEALLSRFLAPTRVGDIASPDGLGVEGNVTCGDVVHIAIKLNDGLIRSARFRVQGCATAIAAADACCELVEGGTITSAQSLEVGELSSLLGGIPPDRVSCAWICLGALRSALDQALGGPVAPGRFEAAQER